MAAPDDYMGNADYQAPEDYDDFCALEVAAQEWVRRGYEPVDSEPGEWIQLRNVSGAVVDLDVWEGRVAVTLS